MPEHYRLFSTLSTVLRKSYDSCYLWYNGSILDCVQNAGDFGEDGAHFLNRAVYAGGRPIPGLYAVSAVNVAGLRNWSLADGWTTTTAPHSLR